MDFHAKLGGNSIVNLMTSVMETTYSKCFRANPKCFWISLLATEKESVPKADQILEIPENTLEKKKRLAQTIKCLIPFCQTKLLSFNLPPSFSPGPDLAASLLLRNQPATGQLQRRLATLRPGRVGQTRPGRKLKAEKGIAIPHNTPNPNFLALVNHSMGSPHFGFFWGWLYVTSSVQHVSTTSPQLSAKTFLPCVVLMLQHPQAQKPGAISQPAPPMCLGYFASVRLKRGFRVGWVQIFEPQHLLSDMQHFTCLNASVLRDKFSSTCQHHFSTAKR